MYLDGNYTQALVQAAINAQSGAIVPVELASGFLKINPQAPLVIGNQSYQELRGAGPSATYVQSDTVGGSRRGTIIRVKSAGVKISNMVIDASGHGAAIHINAAECTLDNVAFIHRAGGQGTCVALDSLDDNGNQIPGAYSHTFRDVNVQRGDLLPQHVFVGVSWLGVSGKTGGAFVVGERISTAGGALAEIVEVTSSGLKIIRLNEVAFSGTVAAAVSGATFTAGAAVESQMNAMCMERVLSQCPNPVLLRSGGGNRSVGCRWQTAVGGTCFQLLGDCGAWSSDDYIEFFSLIVKGNNSAYGRFVQLGCDTSGNAQTHQDIVYVDVRNGGGGSVSYASQAEAEAGANNTKVMTPLRVSQAIDALAPAGGGSGTAAHVYTDGDTHTAAGTNAEYVHNLKHTIPANTLANGKALRVTLTWRLNTGTSVPSLETSLRLGGAKIVGHDSNGATPNIVNGNFSSAYIISAKDAAGASAPIEAAPVIYGQTGISAIYLHNRVAAPANRATNGALDIEAVSKWHGSAGTGTHTVKLVSMLVEEL